MPEPRRQALSLVHRVRWPSTAATPPERPPLLVLFHGVGLCDEYPAIPYPSDWDRSGYDGHLEAGMVLCVESYVGRHGGAEGVKLEDQVLITATGPEVLSTYPRDERLAGSS